MLVNPTPFKITFVLQNSHDVVYLGIPLDSTMSLVPPSDPDKVAYC